MKKSLFIVTGLLVAGLLTACGSYTDIPSESTQDTLTTVLETTEASVLPNDPASAGFYTYSLVRTAYNGNDEASTAYATIDMDRAIDAALSHVNLNLDDIYNVEAELEYETFGTFWEVEFESDGQEYSFYIDAESGNVVRHSIEYDD